MSQKWEQISASRELEKSWSKREILEAYLNLSTFRGELQGIQWLGFALTEAVVFYGFVGGLLGYVLV